MITCEDNRPISWYVRQPDNLNVVEKYRQYRMKEDFRRVVQQRTHVHDESVDPACASKGCDVPRVDSRDDMDKYLHWIDQINRQQNDDVEKQQLSFRVVMFKEK